MTPLKATLRRLGHLRFLRFGIRDRIIRAFHHPDRAANEPFEVGFFGVLYPGNFSTFLDWSVYYYGAYAREELELMGDCLAWMRDPILLDVGANVGHHTLFASTKATLVHAFEPFPPVLRQLMEKRDRNGLRNVQIHEVGLGDADAELDYYPPETPNTGTGSFQPSGSTRGPIRLQVRRGDTYLREAGVDRVHFIKLDVEGFEVPALTGLCETLTASRPVCLFEWSPERRVSGKEVQPCELFPQGYEFFALIADPSFAGVFQQPGYRLARLGRAPQAVNLVGFPREFVRRIRDLGPRTPLGRALAGGPATAA